jgi:hypothetical protein
MAEAKDKPGPTPSGVNKRMSIVLKAEGYATSENEWLVPEELLRPYAIAYNAAIAAAGLEISKAIYEKLLEDGFVTAENWMARSMLEANG